MLAAFTGYVVISRVPAILHTPADERLELHPRDRSCRCNGCARPRDNAPRTGIGFVAVILGAANVTGGYVVTERILQMFDRSGKKPGKEV